jgi:hypothetical protein
MKRRFTIDGFDFAVYSNLDFKVTIVTIVKDDQVIMNEMFSKSPFAIDYPSLIANL